MSMNKVGAESSDRASLSECGRPESSNMSAVSQLIFIHEPEWSGEWMIEGNTSCRQTFSQFFGQILQHFAAPGKRSSIFGLCSAWKEIGLPFGEVVFDGLAELIWSDGMVLVHGGSREQGRCQIGWKQDGLR